MVRNTIPAVLLAAALVTLHPMPLWAQSGRNPARNTVVGAGIGAATGLVFGAAAPESCCIPFGWSRGAATALWTGVGALGGAAIGFTVGQLGREPWPAWATTLAGAGLGGVAGALGGVIGGADSDMTGWYTAFGAGTGAAVGVVVGLLNRPHSTAGASPHGQLLVHPGRSGLLLGWRAPVRF